MSIVFHVSGFQEGKKSVALEFGAACVALPVVAGSVNIPSSPCIRP